ncbi:ATP-dependent DNA helicase [Quillaja saponaria]|uniref:ATP-dependent DNA helicase n=1 Tax=Quillaja saponaria TaxID=32244 RepID=A0AAD7QAL8_QUISA|nr:ATP-dependent DNA helicase [Quillaja saponaria]
MVQGIGSDKILSFSDKDSDDRFNGFTVVGAAEGLDSDIHLSNKRRCLNSEDEVHFVHKRKKLRVIDAEKHVRFDEFLKRPPPIGLKLRKSPSLVDLIEMTLRNTKSGHGHETTIDTQHNNKYDFVSQSEKLKASNFPASVLKIGSFTCMAKHEADLVAKCYYAKRKLVWEILDKGLKNKIEIQWGDISAIRATIKENRPGILEIEVSQPPLFHHESDPQPRKHTLWKPSTDFTWGQASIHRRHYLEFPPGALDKPYEKLIQNDNRLLELSQKPFPSSSSPYFPPNFYNGVANFDATEINTLFQLPFPCIPTSMLPTKQVQQFGNMTPPSIVYSDSGSPTSIMDVHSPLHEFINKGMNDFSNFSAGDQFQNYVSTIPSVEGLESPGLNKLRDITMTLFNDQESEIGVAQQEMYLSRVKSLCSFAGIEEVPANNTSTDTKMLSDIENHLLEDSQGACNNKGQVLTRVYSWDSLINTLEVQNSTPTNNERQTYEENLGDENGLLYPQPQHQMPPPQVLNEDLFFVPELDVYSNQG